MIRTVNYTPRFAVKPDVVSWRDVALFAVKGLLLVAGLFVIREAVYSSVAADLAPFATAAAFCAVAWLYAVLKSRRDGEAMRIATVALWSAFMVIAIAYLLFG